MGYTHYYQQGSIPTPALFQSFTTHVLELVQASGIAIQVTIEPDFLSINGADGEDYEDFVIRRNDLTWDFCKTARRPYDTVVTAVLILARYTFPDFHLSSDGSWLGWLFGRKLFTSVMHLEPTEATVFGMATV